MRPSQRATQGGVGASGTGEQDVVAAAAAGGISTTANTGGGRGGGGAGGGRGCCQDCGNKAKRECEHNRCRICCKSRGLVCPTHVKSTWVPVSHRRQRHHYQHFSLLGLPHRDFFPLSLHDLSPSSAGVEGGGEGGNFLSEVQTTATCRCVRVSSDDIYECAYQASVNIGGHLFRGILYHQGPVDDATMFGGPGGDSSSSEHQVPHHQYLVYRQLELQQPNNVSGNGGGSGGGGGGMNLLYPPPSSSSLYPSDVPDFRTCVSPGMQFFPHQKP